MKIKSFGIFFWIFILILFWLEIFLIDQFLQFIFLKKSIHELSRLSSQEKYFWDWFFWSSLFTFGSVFSGWLGSYYAKRQNQKALQVFAHIIEKKRYHDMPLLQQEGVLRYYRFADTLARFDQWKYRNEVLWKENLKDLYEQLRSELKEK